MLLAAVVSAALAGILGQKELLLFAVLGALLALISQCGDLAESALKRHFNVKDSGALIPGHGGILDRVDGILFAAPAVALAALVPAAGMLPWR